MSFEATCTWPEVPEADGYRVYQQGVMLVDVYHPPLVLIVANDNGPFEIEPYNRWGVGPRTVGAITRV
jgi:hypothetical protein